jgi:hypothetical protein
MLAPILFACTCLLEVLQHWRYERRLAGLTVKYKNRKDFVHVGSAGYLLVNYDVLGILLSILSVTTSQSGR